MPYFGPISWRNLIQALREAGFHGPYSGKRHPFMLRNGRKLILPNPHKDDIGTNLLHRLLQQADISREEWEQL
ncbi:MAG: type II toxin-antitoxin system HicA family toxin [Pleurocapsa sp. SU_196_0]|nr:type II toxin-antitoxin system HicA family toxin [Pleurocapsa sp. SU_196_0]